VRQNEDPAPVPDPGIVNVPDNNVNLLLNVNFNNNQKLMGTSFAIQNVRSLNISTKNEITLQKIIAVCNLDTDFIFLSDLRLNSEKQISAVNDLDKRLFLKGYKLIHNSTNSLRGVGILIKKKFSDEGFKIVNIERSADCNIICAHVEISGQSLVLCSIYGPNKDTEINFYEELKNILRPYNCPFIIGGDWNATFDNSGVNFNLDTLNMQNIPSHRRTTKILELCQEFNLVEPFRTGNPNTREYTFIPSGVQDTNRSRIDFFLINTALYNPDTLSKIPHSLTSTMFDHKPVFLKLKRKKIVKRDIIKDTILNNPDLDAHVQCAVFECYTQHYLPITPENTQRKDDLLVTLGRGIQSVAGNRGYRTCNGYH